MTNRRDQLLAELAGGVIASIQARPGGPLDRPDVLAALAASAVEGGAVALRVDRPENIAAVAAVTDRPILGINKVIVPGYDVYITPTVQSAADAIDAGAQLLAVDGTDRTRPDGTMLTDIVDYAHARDVLVFADISTFDEGQYAAHCGADIIATTLAGYTAYSSRPTDGPALELAAELVQRLSAPIAVEGGIVTPAQVKAAFAAGVWAVCIGGAISNIAAITQRFVRASKEHS